MNHNLTKPPLYWRSGVVLEIDGSRALVRADAQAARIFVSVDGPGGGRRSALAPIRDAFRSIHTSIKALDVAAKVPLPEDPSVLLDFEDLIAFEGSGVREYPVRLSDGTIVQRNISELLDGVVAREERLEKIIDPVDPGRYRIAAGDHAHITVVEAGIRSTAGSAPAGQPIGGNGAPNSWLSSFSSWRFSSIACGIGAVLVAIVLMLLPSNEWRALVGGLIGLGLLVTAFMLSMNPMYFYRRILSYVIPGGLLLGAAGFSIDAFATSEPVAGWFRWNSEVSGWFFGAWAVVVVSLIIGDLKQSR